MRLFSQVGFFRILRVLVFNPLKLINLIQVSLSYFFSRGTIWGVPPVLIIEPSTYCQLRCPLCIRQNSDFNRKDMHLDICLIEKILKECGNRLCAVLLYHQGEPFFHPDIIEIMKLFKRYNIIVKVSTNGNYKKDMSREIVQSKVDHITFDVDGDSQEVYEKYRIDGSLDLLLSNLRKLSEAKRESNSKIPFVEARLIAMKHNIDRIGRVKTLLEPYDINLFTLKKCIVRDEDEFIDAMSFIPDVFNRLGCKTPDRCYYPWAYFCILVNGDVSPCCYDEKGKTIFGNIQKDSIKTIMGNPLYIKFRKAVKKDPLAVDMCKECDIAGDFYLPYDEFKNIARAQEN